MRPQYIKIAAIQDAIKKYNTTEEKIQALALFVAEHFGGNDNEYLLALSDDELNTILEKRESKKVKIGELKYGVCRHRSILFKRLAQENMSQWCK